MRNAVLARTETGNHMSVGIQSTRVHEAHAALLSRTIYNAEGDKLRERRRLSPSIHIYGLWFRIGGDDRDFINDSKNQHSNFNASF